MGRPLPLRDARGAQGRLSSSVLAPPAERWPAGDYTVQSTGGEGLPKWTAADRSLAPGADPVLWHTFGATHVPRPEDFPVMPCEVTGGCLCGAPPLPDCAGLLSVHAVLPQSCRPLV